MMYMVNRDPKKPVISVERFMPLGDDEKGKAKPNKLSPEDIKRIKRIYNVPISNGARP